MLVEAGLNETFPSPVGIYGLVLRERRKNRLVGFIGATIYMGRAKIKYFVVSKEKIGNGVHEPLLKRHLMNRLKQDNLIMKK